MDIFHLLGATGLTFIITRSYIMEQLRDYTIRWPGLHHLVNCPQCSGFWCGVIVFSLTLSPLKIILGALATSGLCYVISSLLDRDF